MAEETKTINPANKLFSEFEPSSKEKWFLKVLDELNGNDFDKTLNWHPFSGSTIFPIYTSQDLNEKSFLEVYQHASGNREDTGMGPRKWHYLETITVDDYRAANRKALQALNTGADGVIFKLDAMISFDAMVVLLHDIKPQHAEICFETSAPAMQLLALYRSFLNEYEIPFHTIKGKLFFSMEQTGPVNIGEVHKLALEMPYFQVFCIEATSSGNEAQKLASLLTQWHKFINQMAANGFDEGEIARNCFFTLRTNNHFFIEIAMVRALRFLLTEWLSFYGVEEIPNKWEIHSFTTPSYQNSDPNTNILSNTNQAMAAIIGGCNSLSILPHDLSADKKSFSDRVARNISNLLREEAFFDKVSDPAAGSYYLESLTLLLAEKAWEDYRKGL